MDVTERINLLIGHCREAQYPEALLTALSAYLSGEGSLAQVQQEWRALPLQNRALPPSFSVLSGDHVDSLDELDRRRLDICIATNHLEEILESLGDDAPIETLFHHLQKQPGQQQKILEYLIGCYDWMRDDKPTPMGRLLLCYLPQQFLAMLPLMQQKRWDSEYEEFLELLVSAQPPYADLAWQTIQQVPQGNLGDCVAPLLKADVARFRDWARQLASPSGPGDESDQIGALLALFDHDFANNIDLAVAIASGKRTFSNRWNSRRAQQSALTAVYRSNPNRYLPLVGEAVVSKEYHLYDTALDLLEESDPEQARPVLQHAAAAGAAPAAVRATKRLLASEWAGRQDYALSLLAHRFKQVRDVAIEWLLPQGETLIDHITPLLADKSAYTRLAAVEILARLGGERAHALLCQHRDLEKSVSVKQAIVDAIGLPEPPADLDPSIAIADLLKEAASGGKKSPLRWFAAEEPTDLRWVNGAPVPPSVVNYLLTCQARMHQMQLEMNVRRILQWLDRRTTGTLALTLFTDWAKQGSNARESWLLPLIATLGDDRLVQFLRKQIDALGRKSRRRALGAKAVQTLALIGTDLAFTEVSDLARHAKTWQIQQAARAAFAEAASRHNLSQEELADRIAPRLGFNEQGEQTFDFGPRQFTARLGFDLTIHLKNNNGKRLTLLPRPNTHDDAVKVAAAQSAWQVLKKHLAPAIKIQAERLENALSTQRAWSVASWRELFLRHPLLRAFAVNLVWGVLTADSVRYATIFRPLEDGSLTTADDEACVLPAEGLIRLVHPIELDEGTRSAWLQHLADYEVTPPFPQLNRPVALVSPEECAALWWDKYQGYLMNGAALKGRYMKAGWERGPVQDAGAYYTIWKAFPAAGVQAVLETAGMSVGYEQEFSTAIKRLAFARVDTSKRGSYVYDDLKDQDERLIKLGDVPPIIFSEIAADVQTFAAAGEYTEDWEKKVW